VVVSTSAFGPNQICPNGGINVQSGIDDNGNGVLDPAEVDVVQEVCNGTDGLDALIKVTPEPAGANCAFGGQRIDAGIDANGNSVLDPGEATSTDYICNGSDGLPTPVITGVNPEEAKEGQEVRITGAGFGATQGTSSLTIGGASALPTDIISWGEHEIRAKVPVGASTGIVTITVAGVQSNPGFFVLLWMNEYPVNTAICTAADTQEAPVIAPDGAGGAIIAWQDYRSGTDNDIYAQRVDASGNPLWTASGVAISTAAGSQESPRIVTDGTGGAIIAWEDTRSGNYDIYAQRVDSSGNPLWTANGVAISSAANNQTYIAISPDGSGGAVIAWEDNRSGNWDIYAQRVDDSGNVQWTINGVAVSTAADSQYFPVIAPDGTGGAIIAWFDYRSGTDYDIYAQRVDASGTALWTTNGIAVCTAAYDQHQPVISADSSGGAIIAWADDRGFGSSEYDIYAQRVDASGTALWTTNGIAVCTAANPQGAPHIVPDGQGGAIIAWDDNRRAAGHADIYAQRVDVWGNTLWTADGMAMSTEAAIATSRVIAADGTGGAIIAWADYRSGIDYDIYAQRVDLWGYLHWAADGLIVSTAVNSQFPTAIVPDGSGGAIIAWQDYRSGSDWDIYAQGISASGSQ